MKLPNAQKAVVDIEKLRNYCLSFSHPRGRNPQTGEALKIPAKKVPKFSPGTELKAAVNRKK